MLANGGLCLQDESDAYMYTREEPLPEQRSVNWNIHETGKAQAQFVWMEAISKMLE